MSKLIELPNVTLVALSSINISENIKALKYSMRKIKFGDCVFISHKKPVCLPKNIRFVQTSELKEIDDFNYKILFELHKHIKTDFVLLVHYDGFVVNPEMWRPEFLNYDYIGAPWFVDDEWTKDIDGNTIRVGNSVSIRSKKILELPTKLNLPFHCGEGKANHEDLFLCCRYRHIFLQQGVRYAPLEIAKYFSHESMMPEIEGIKPFAFHKWMGSNRQYKNFESFLLLKYFWSFIKRTLRSGIIASLRYYFAKYVKK